MAAGTVTTLGCLRRSAGRSRPQRSLVPFMRSSSGMNKLFLLFAMYAVFIVISSALSMLVCEPFISDQFAVLESRCNSKIRGIYFALSCISNYKVSTTLYMLKIRKYTQQFILGMTEHPPHTVLQACTYGRHVSICSCRILMRSFYRCNFNGSEWESQYIQGSEQILWVKSCSPHMFVLEMCGAFWV